MPRSNRLNNWICAALLLVAFNLYAFAAWRWQVRGAGRPEAFLGYQSSPLLADYERATARATELQTRFANGDPAVTIDEVRMAQSVRMDAYGDFVEDDNARVASAWSLENSLIDFTALAGCGLCVLAGGWFAMARMLAHKETELPDILIPIADTGAADEGPYFARDQGGRVHLNLRESDGKISAER